MRHNDLIFNSICWHRIRAAELLSFRKAERFLEKVVSAGVIAVLCPRRMNVPTKCIRMRVWIIYHRWYWFVYKLLAKVCRASSNTTLILLAAVYFGIRFSSLHSVAFFVFHAVIHNSFKWGIFGQKFVGPRSPPTRKCAESKWQPWAERYSATAWKWWIKPLRCTHKLRMFYHTASNNIRRPEQTMSPSRFPFTLLRNAFFAFVFTKTVMLW